MSKYTPSTPECREYLEDFEITVRNNAVGQTLTRTQRAYLKSEIAQAFEIAYRQGQAGEQIRELRELNKRVDRFIEIVQK